MTLVRNETQRHSAALKNAGQNPISLLPLDNTQILYKGSTCGFSKEQDSVPHPCNSFTADKEGK